MERRQFLWICGCAGAGMLIGLHSADPVWAAQPRAGISIAARRNTWMYGSVRTGCARLPHAEPLHREPAAFIFNEYL